MNIDNWCQADRCMAWQPKFTADPTINVLNQSLKTDKGYCGMIQTPGAGGN
jgi:hypothetical protein